MGGGSSNQGKSHSSSKSVSDQFSDAFSFGENFSSGSSTSGGYNYSTSQNQSQQQSQSTSDSIGITQSQSGTSDSTISNLQAGILQSREGLFDSWFMPNLNAAMGQATPGSKEFNAQTALANSQINSQFNAANKATMQTLAQQGLLGGSNGVNAMLQAANNRARSSALAQAYFNQLSNAQNNKAQLINLMGGQMAKPTTDTAYHQASTSNGINVSSSQSTSSGESSGSSESIGEQYSQASQSSYGYQGSQSHSEGHSQSSSNGWSKNNGETHNMFGF